MSVMNALIGTVAALPAEGIFDVGGDIAGDLKKLLLTVAGAIIAFLVLQFLTRAKTVSAAFIAILVGAALFWALDNIQNPAIKSPLDDTINEYGMDSPAPAPDVLPTT